MVCVCVCVCVFPYACHAAECGIEVVVSHGSAVSLTRRSVNAWPRWFSPDVCLCDVLSHRPASWDSGKREAHITTQQVFRQLGKVGACCTKIMPCTTWLKPSWRNIPNTKSTVPGTVSKYLGEDVYICAWHILTSHNRFFILTCLFFCLFLLFCFFYSPRPSTCDDGTNTNITR